MVIVLSEEFEFSLEAYNEGVFAFTPRYYEYLNLAVGYKKNRDTAIVRIKGFCFLPTMYHKGGVWRTNLDDQDITEEMWNDAVKRGPEALQDLQYKADGPHTFWTLAIQLGEIVEVRKK